MLEPWETQAVLSEAERATMRRAIDALATMDIDALVAEYHPEVEFVGLPGAPETLTGQGPDVARGLLEEISQPMEDVAIEVEEIVETRDRVLCHARLTGVGLASGAPIDTRVAWIWTFRDGRIDRVEIHRDWSQARQSAGLET